MRFTTLVSFVLALGLAGLAVYGAQIFLAQERAQIANVVQPVAAPVESRTIVIAAERIALGERLNSSKLREIEWASSVIPDGSFAKIEDLIQGDTDDVARFAIGSISSGEPILSTRITDPGVQSKMSTVLEAGMFAASIRVNDVNGVAGFVLPGDRVDVLLTRGGRDQESYVDTLLQGVKVLAIDQFADDRSDQPSVVRTVTFEVTSKQSKKLVLAANVGSISLALRNLASTAVEDQERITVGDLTDWDAANDVMLANLAALAAQAEGPDPQDERLQNLEALLKNLSAGITERIDGVEQKIRPAEPVIVEKEVIVERVVRAPVFKPKDSTVGVIRNGQRAEYKVKQSDGGELVLVDSDLQADGDAVVVSE